MNIGRDSHDGPMSSTGENGHMVAGASGLARRGPTDHWSVGSVTPAWNSLGTHKTPTESGWEHPQNSHRPRLEAPTKLTTETRCALKTQGRKHPQNLQASTHKTRPLDTHKTLRVRGPLGGSRQSVQVSRGSIQTGPEQSKRRRHASCHCPVGTDRFVGVLWVYDPFGPIYTTEKHCNASKKRGTEPATP